MKGFWKIVLIIVLTLVTAAAGVFGYFFFAGKDYYDFNGENKEQTITIAKANEIVTTACEELGWLTNTGASTQSVEYSDYNGDLSFGDEISERFFKLNVVTAKYMLDAMEDNNIAPNKYYYDKQQLDPNSSYSTEMMGYVNINGNKAEIHVYDVGIDAEIVLVVTGDLEYGKSWSVEYYSNKIGAHAYTYAGGMGYGIIAANEVGIYQFAYSSIAFNSSSREISRDNLLIFDIYDCDTQMKHLLDVKLKDMSDEDITKYGNATVDNVNRVTYLNWENVKIEKQINFLNEFWTAMGMK